jgi:hypothetical protein
MAIDQQFLDALKYAGQEGQQLGIKSQLDQVNQRAQDIQDTMTNEVDRRQALTKLAQAASISVAGSGGSTTQVAAINNLIPPIPSTVNQAYLQGALTGDTQMQGVATKMLNDDENRQGRMAERKFAFELMKMQQMEKLKPNPETMAIKKENRAKLDDLMSAKDKAVQSISDLNDIKNRIQKSAFGTGGLGVAGNAAGLPQYEELNQKMKQIGFQNMTTMFAGMSKAISTENEQKAFAATQLDIGHKTATNLDYIQGQIKLHQGLIKKTNNAISSYNSTGGLSFNSLDPIDAPTVKPDSFQTLTPQGAAKAFYKE